MNLEALTAMDYPGRFLIIGRSVTDANFIIYGVTGRSPPSQARRLISGEKTKFVSTQVTDEEQLKKGSRALLIYPAMMHHQAALMASNGMQTELLYNLVHELHNERNLAQESDLPIRLEQRMRKPHFTYDQEYDRVIDITTYEPDPNHTARISSIVQNSLGTLHIVRARGDKQNPLAMHQEFYYDMRTLSAQGVLLATYNGENINPLPAFEGKPRPIEHAWEGPIEAVADVWNSLNPATRVSVATLWLQEEKIISAIMNKHPKQPF